MTQPPGSDPATPSVPSMYAARVNWFRLSKVGNPINWTQETALRKEGGGQILTEAGAPIAFEGSPGGPPDSPIAWVTAPKGRAIGWNLEQPIRQEGGGQILTESGAPLITEQGGAGGVASPIFWVQPLEGRAIGWDRDMGILDERGQPILTEGGAPLIFEPGIPGPTPPHPPHKPPPPSVSIPLLLAGRAVYDRPRLELY